MIGKMKIVFTIVLIIMLVFAIGYSIVKLISNAFKTPDLITSEEIVLYSVDSKLLTNHSRFYYIEKCLENLIEGCRQEKYTEAYNLYLSDYKKEYTKEEIISKLKAISNKDNTITLNKVYVVNDLYLLELEVNNEQTHMLMRLGETKQSSYNFAFIK